MTAVIAPEKQYTPDELLAMPDGNHYEWVEGKLVEKSVGAKSDWIAGRIFARISVFSEGTSGGWAFPEVSYRCFAEEPGRVRRPDVSYLRAARLPPDGPPDGYLTSVPDLVVEVISPNDIFWEVHARLQEYLRAGVALVWVVIPESRSAEVFRSNGTASILFEDQALDGEDVLPGFRCPLVDVLPSKPAVMSNEASG